MLPLGLGLGGWGPGCFDFLYRAPHPLNKATAAWLMVVNTLLTFISYKSLSTWSWCIYIYIYRWYINRYIYIYIMLDFGLFIDHGEFHAWVPARPRWSFALPTSDVWRNSRPWPLDCCCFQGWESVQRWWWWWWWWWWWELHDTWYTTLALFGVQNRGVIAYYICIYIYILPIYYLVYIYVQVYIHIFITKCYYTRHNTHTHLYIYIYNIIQSWFQFTGWSSVVGVEILDWLELLRPTRSEMRGPSSSSVFGQELHRHPEMAMTRAWHHTATSSSQMTGKWVKIRLFIPFYNVFPLTWLKKLSRNIRYPPSIELDEGKICRHPSY